MMPPAAKNAPLLGAGCLFSQAAIENPHWPGHGPIIDETADGQRE